MAIASGISYDPFYIARKNTPAKGQVASVSGGGSARADAWRICRQRNAGRRLPGPRLYQPYSRPDVEASKAVNSGGGVLHIVKDDTGDVMNFELAADLLRGENINVETVLTDDNYVAVENSLYTAGRRGVGLTVLMEKLLGGAAEADVIWPTLSDSVTPSAIPEEAWAWR